MKKYIYSLSPQRQKLCLIVWLTTKQRSYLEIIGIQNIEYPSYNAKELCNKFTGYESVKLNKIWELRPSFFFLLDYRE